MLRPCASSVSRNAEYDWSYILPSAESVGTTHSCRVFESSASEPMVFCIVTR